MNYRSAFYAILTVITFLSAGWADESIRNPILLDRADPWVVRYGEKYLWCFSENSRGISLFLSDTLEKLGDKHVVWTAPETGPASQQVWAPELHRIDDNWYIYFAASDGKNENHRAFVLKSKSDDPLGAYDLYGPLYTGDDFNGRTNNRWAIDMTVLHHDKKLYAIWSGWQGEEDVQHLFIASLSDPCTISSPRVRICNNDDYLWERTEETPDSRGLHEGPQILCHGNRTFLIYSCGASWLTTYKLALLELVGDDPLDPRSWQKHREPVFNRTQKTLGPGHACFLEADGERWIVYHAKRGKRSGWLRDVFIQRFKFDSTGFPSFGRPVERKPFSH